MGLVTIQSIYGGIKVERLTHERCSGIKSGYWSPAKKEEIVQALGAYEDTGLTPEEVQRTKWTSTKTRLPDEGEEVFVLTEAKNGSRNIDKGYILNGRFIHRGSAQVIYWMPLPKPPKQ